MYKVKTFFLLAVMVILPLYNPIQALAGISAGQVSPHREDLKRHFLASLGSLGKTQASEGLTKPRGLGNPYLLNMESGSAPPEMVFTSAFQIGGSGVTQIGATAVDADGNFFVTGGFTGAIDFDGATLSGNNSYDFFLAKLDPSGNLLWARVAQGVVMLAENLAIEGGIAIAVDSAGDCYVGGAFVDSLSFQDDADNVVTRLTDGRADSTINFEMFVAKYSSAGTLLWAQGGNSGSAGGVNNLGAGVNAVTSLILDREDYPYIGGRYSGTDFLGESVSPQGGSDFMLASLDPDTGAPIWVRLVGTPDNDGLLSLSVDSLGFINTLGYIGTGELIIPGFSDTYMNNSGFSDTFVMSYDINGEWFFISIIGGDEIITGNDVASDSVGNIYVTGDFSGTASFVGSDITLSSKGGASDGYIVKYDLNGTALWAKRFGNQAAAKGSRIVVDENGNSYILGIFSDTIVFDEENSNPVVLTANAFTDMFIAKYNSSGNFEWVKQIDGSGAESLDLIASEQVPVTTNPVELLYDRNNGGELILSGDFNDMLFLDDFTLDSGENSRSGFVATLNLASNPTGVAEKTSTVITDFTLQQNYPNPFNPATTLKFALPQAENVTIDVFNALGQKIETLVNTRLASGSHEVIWDASRQASGSYFYTLKAGQFTETKKMVLLK